MCRSSGGTVKSGYWLKINRKGEKIEFEFPSKLFREHSDVEDGTKSS